MILFKYGQVKKINLYDDVSVLDRRLIRERLACADGGFMPFQHSGCDFQPIRRRMSLLGWVVGEGSALDEGLFCIVYLMGNKKCRERHRQAV